MATMANNERTNQHRKEDSTANPDRFFQPKSRKKNAQSGASAKTGKNHKITQTLLSGFPVFFGKKLEEASGSGAKISSTHGSGIGSAMKHCEAVDLDRTDKGNRYIDDAVRKGEGEKTNSQ